MGQAAAGVAALTGFAGSVMDGIGAERSANAAADQAKQKASIARTAAAQTGAKYADEMRSTLANINAIRASAGADPFSATSRAVKDEETRVSNRDSRIAVGNLEAEAKSQDKTSSLYARQARWALLGGVVNGVAKAATSLSQIKTG